jgi:hypothetical protein
LYYQNIILPAGSFVPCHTGLIKRRWIANIVADGATSTSGLTSLVLDTLQSGPVAAQRLVAQRLNCRPYPTNEQAGGDRQHCLTAHLQGCCPPTAASTRLRARDVAIAFTPGGPCHNHFAASACHGPKSTLAWCVIRPSRIPISFTMRTILHQFSSCCQGDGSRGMWAM